MKKITLVCALVATACAQSLNLPPSIRDSTSQPSSLPPGFGENTEETTVESPSFDSFDSGRMPPTELIDKISQPKETEETIPVETEETPLTPNLPPSFLDDLGTEETVN